MNNVKLHLKLSGSVSHEELSSILNSSNAIRHNNYYILRESHSKVVYSVFPKSGFVNITGVKNFEDVENVLRMFNTRFGLNVSPCELITDSSTASGRIVDQNSEESTIIIDLEHIKHIVDTESIFTDINASLSPASFPGIVIRSKSTPTCLIFTSGRFIIVGGKSKQSITAGYQQICAIMEKYMKMPQKDMFIA